LRQLRGRILSDGVVCVFAEPQFPPRIIETIIEGTPARRGTLDPLGVALPAGPGMYAALLEGLARDMKSCLGEPS
jgi:zinc transport system substrate-binding protein